MTKSQEIQRLQRIIDGTPADSYLGSLLRHLAPQFEQDIRSDFPTLPNLPEICHEHWEAIKKRDEVLKQVREAQAKLDGLKNDADIFKAKLQNYRARFDDIARDAMQAKHRIPLEVTQ